MAYARWQLLDYLWQRLLLPLFLAAMLTFFTLYSVTEMSSKPGFWAAPDGMRFAMNMLRQAMGTFIPLAVLMAMNGVVAQDRQKGYFRFFFSKPVPVTGFYLSAFVIHLAVAAAAAGAVAAVIGAFSAPQPVFGTAMACALTFVLLGSLMFLLSTLTYQDGIVFIAVWLGTLLIRQVEPTRTAGHWMHTAVRFLPPTQRLDAVRDALYGAQPYPMNDVWHVLAYGGACLLLAVIALRTLPLAR
jgi:ABC-type transport system involved in multi-copper enzyme maturation permease subunit